jgi:hypothetical protein
MAVLNLDGWRDGGLNRDEVVKSDNNKKKREEAVWTGEKSKNAKKGEREESEKSVLKWFEFESPSGSASPNGE